METRSMIRIGTKIVVMTALLGAVAGCFGPTYGTGKTAGAQLAEDLGDSLSLGKKNRTKIEYAPRPDIVRPADTNSLPAPQEKIAESSEDWPETPEQQRARILTDIEAGNRPANFVTNREEADALGASEGPGRQTVAGRRIYLTDPPTEYREPAQTAEYGELGQSEASKERARKRASKGSKTGWRKLVPWL